MNNRQMLDKWREFYATALFDLPAAAAQSLLPDADRQREQRLGTAAWRAYDAWIWLVNETANHLYSTSTGRPSAYARRLRLASTAPQAEGQPSADGNRGYQSNDRREAR